MSLPDERFYDPEDSGDAEMNTEHKAILDCEENFVPNDQCYCGYHIFWNGKKLEKVIKPEYQPQESIPIFNKNRRIKMILSLATGIEQDPMAKEHLFDVIGIINPHYMSCSLLIEKLEKLGMNIDQVEKIDDETFFNAGSNQMGYFFSIWLNPEEKKILLQILEYWFTTNKIMPNSFWSNSDYKPEFELWMLNNRCRICIEGKEGNCHNCKADWFATGKKAGYW